ncbi:MAG TPA: DUF4139 domain-containing protein [Candidatus Sulfotelmatobacter sp.]|nr:DUF4139 domain-containing protein [Candidatus Sulfotelmatobacter sp.]
MVHRLLPLAALAAGLIAAAAPAARAAPLELKRVALSSGGVGYFEYQATVSGDDTLALDARLDQIDDIMKSLVVYDDRGSVVGVELQSREPVGQILRDLPFDANALDAPKALFNALRGAEIKVGNPKPMSGRILKADDEVTILRDGHTITRTRVTLITAAGLQQFVLEDVDSVAFVDPTLQAKLDEALSRLARHHDGDRRTLLLHTHGTEKRTVRVGYVVGAPLWKATYRLTFPADPGTGKARLQGWAVLENTTAQDWNGVELTLLSGNPVTFRQALYESYYVTRPEVPVEVIGRVLPKPDQGSVAVQMMRQRAEATSAPAGTAMAPAPGPRGDFAASGAAPPPSLASVAAANAAEGGTQVTFTLPHPVSIGAGRSAELPILDRELNATRLSVLQPYDAQPLAAFELTNDGTTGLPPGVLTLYERAADGAATYVGDARLATFPVGEQRLLSYAVDDKLKVDRTRNDANPIVSAALGAGVLRLTRKIQQTTVYRIAAPAHEARRLIIEQPRAGGWSLTEPDPSGVRMTDSDYRVPIEIGPGEQKSVTVTLERPQQESLRLLDLDDARLGVLISARELPPPLHDALGELARRRQALAEQRTQLQRVQTERETLVQDQARVRDNLNAVPKGTPLYNRLIDTLSNEETRLETLAQTIATANGTIDRATADLADYVNKLSL